MRDPVQLRYTPGGLRIKDPLYIDLDALRLVDKKIDVSDIRSIWQGIQRRYRPSAKSKLIVRLNFSRGIFKEEKLAWYIEHSGKEFTLDDQVTFRPEVRGGVDYDKVLREPEKGKVPERVWAAIRGEEPEK
jgi:hypothetical protein